MSKVQTLSKVESALSVGLPDLVTLQREFDQATELKAKIDGYVADLTQYLESVRVDPITDEATYLEAGEYSEARIKPSVDRIKAAFEGYKSLTFKLHRLISGMEGSLIRPLETFRKAVDESRRTYLREKKQAEEKARAEKEAAIREIFEEKQADDLADQLERYAELKQQGDLSAADSLLKKLVTASSEPVPEVRLAPIKKQKIEDDPTSVRTTLRWSLLNLSALKPEFTITLPDKSGIDAALKSHGKQLPEIVSVDPGNPAVEVVEHKVFASPRKRKLLGS